MIVIHATLKHHEFCKSKIYELVNTIHLSIDHLGQHFEFIIYFFMKLYLPV